MLSQRSRLSITFACHAFCCNKSKVTSTAVSSRVTQSLFINVLRLSVLLSVRSVCCVDNATTSARALRHAVFCCGGGNRTRAHLRLFASLCYALHKGVVLAYSICRFAPLIPAFSASCRLPGCHLSALSSQVPPTVSISCPPAVSDVSAYIPCARALSLSRCCGIGVLH